MLNKSADCQWCLWILINLFVFVRICCLAFHCAFHCPRIMYRAVFIVTILNWFRYILKLIFVNIPICATTLLPTAMVQATKSTAIKLFRIVVTPMRCARSTYFAAIFTCVRINWHKYTHVCEIDILSMVFFTSNDNKIWINLFPEALMKIICGLELKRIYCLPFRRNEQKKAQWYSKRNGNNIANHASSFSTCIHFEIRLVPGNLRYVAYPFYLSQRIKLKSIIIMFRNKFVIFINVTHIPIPTTKLQTIRQNGKNLCVRDIVNYRWKYCCIETCLNCKLSLRAASCCGKRQIFVHISLIVFR